MGNKMSESTCLDLVMAKPNMIIKFNIDSRYTKYILFPLTDNSIPFWFSFMVIDI